MKIDIKTIAFLAIITSGASAAQTVTNTAPWTGFYAGVSAGAIFNEAQLNSSHINFINTPYHQHISDTDFLPGVQAGYNYQFPSGFVLGGELDFTYPDTKSEFNNTNQFAQFDKFTFENRLQGAIRAKMGYALNKFLPFVTAGVSFADTQLEYTNEVAERVKNTSVQTGWALGGGLEYAVYENLSLRTEYIYSDYGDPLSMKLSNVVGVTDPNGFANIELVTHSVRTVINYRF